MNRGLFVLFLLVASVSVLAQAPYCGSGVYGVTCGASDEYITNVTCGSLNQSGGCMVAPAFQDFTTTGPTLTPGVGTSITVTIGNYFSGDNVDVFCDWDSNTSFLDAGEHFVLVDNGSGVFTGTITPPVGAPASTRMRVTLGYYGLQDPCMASEYYGGVWDFTVLDCGQPGNPCPCSTDFSSPGGPGSVTVTNNPCAALAGAAYFWAFTFAPGTFPNGGWFGLDIGLAQLVSFYLAGYPFTGTLDGTGSSSFGVPGGSLPSGLQVWEVTTTWAPGYGFFLLPYSPKSYTIP